MGVRQFVLLGAGYDARAWRLSRLDAGAAVFEVDLPRVHAHKAAALAAAGAPAPACRRVAVEADLADARWPARLLAAGFDRDAPSFFLAEGVLMYLRGWEPAAVLRAARGLMCGGSTIAGDCLVNSVHAQPSFLARWGAPWTFDVSSGAAVSGLLRAAGFADAEVYGLLTGQQDLADEGHGRRVGGSVGVTAPMSQAAWDEEKVAYLRDHILAFETWPRAAVAWLLGVVSPHRSAKEAAILVVTRIVLDVRDAHGLRDLAVAHKERLTRLILASPGFIERLRAAAAEARARFAPPTPAERLCATLRRALFAPGDPAHVTFFATAKAEL
jgi:hypothetical protein